MNEVRMHLVEAQDGQSRVGLAAWLLTVLRRNGLFTAVTGRAERKHMRVVESLPMGPKRHLFLVSCDGERFLVGTGAESVQTIMRVRPEAGVAVMRGAEELR